MKYIIFILVLATTSLSQAEAIKYRSDINLKYYNDVFNRQYDMAATINYDPENNSFDFYIKENLYLTSFTLSRGQSDTLIALIDKYKEWQLKASKKGVKLEKEIGKFEISSTSWKIGNGDWSFGYGVKPTAFFFSLTKQTHQLVLIFPKFKSKYNQYSTHNPESVYLDFKEAMKLRKALTDESVQSFLIKAKKQAEIEAEFN